jgi:putative nucleotidyltransferase with HDIG domain
MKNPRHNAAKSPPTVITMKHSLSLQSQAFRTPEAKADALLACLADSADHDYIGEPISQLEHALQAAASGSRVGAPDEVVLAALFHDVGHLIAPDAPQMDGLGVVSHEELGAELLLEFGCSENMADLVRCHVEAKRYLCHKNPKYHARLSDASRGTLAWQGGPMTSGEAAAFEDKPTFKHILALRSWDEQAKIVDANVPSLASYRAMLIAHLNRHEATNLRTKTAPS